MASPGRSSPCRSSSPAVASRLSSSPDRFAPSEFDICSLGYEYPTEHTENSDRSDNRTLTVNTTSAEALGTGVQSDGEAHDAEEEASPIHPGGSMQDIPRQFCLEFSGNNTDFSAKLSGIPVDLFYSMNRFFIWEKYRPDQETEALKMPSGSAEKIKSGLGAVKRCLSQTEEDKALCLIGSVHARSPQTFDNQNLKRAPSLPAASNHAEAATAESSESEQISDSLETNH